MNVFRCTGCGAELFERRASCPSCFGESFEEVDAGEPEAIVSSRLTVTPEGFADSYDLFIGKLGKARAIYRKE